MSERTETPGEDVLQTTYDESVSQTTTVRLSDEDRHLLALLVPEYGDQSSVIRHGIRRLAEEQQQRQELQQQQELRQRQELKSLLRDWEAESGPPHEEAMAEVQRRYFDQ